jgi:hypothetical protein
MATGFLPITMNKLPILPLYAVRYTLHASRNCPLHLSRGLYKSPLFMQNKPNLLNTKMNVSKVLTNDYENKSNWTLGENKPNQTQFQIHHLYSEMSDYGKNC